MMFTLRVAPDWAEQVRRIRESVTEESHLIRPDNGFYRICHAGDASFQVRVLPGSGMKAVELRLRESDLEVTHVDGRLDGGRPDSGAARLDEHALMVLSVVGSLRSDALAARIGQLRRVASTGLPGAPAQLPASELRQDARTWGPASESIFNALSSTARGIALKRRAELTPLQRHFSERVELAKVEPGLQAAARGIAVLKRPK
ncbi:MULTISPECIES: hypothetical protein [unclassified Rhizobacter]|uniref:hypothetical protein n=1 Tax=unclassified Rhizobacter TaxID=2640088 RepID=UPI0006FA675C|nr:MULTISPECIES: hypothetical protein [unclassified Rhizobacter]KQU67168.1 hypothetical protein ASC88_09155 [Rhizobacter sp. Root29]KQV98121.1 hypothetical protein ASC98_08910 [Rhizobacter sp. Root1238]KRB02019.1 hypothetical protein ASE08_16470 [Rhizobacter sp. Root16D2]